MQRSLSAATITSGFWSEALTAFMGFIQRLLCPPQGVAEWTGIKWRNETESGGAFKWNRVAACAGIRT